MGNADIGKHRHPGLGARPKDIDGVHTSEIRLRQSISRTETKLKAMRDCMEMGDMHEIGQLAKGVAADATDIAMNAAVRATLTNVEDGTYRNPKTTVEERAAGLVDELASVIADVEAAGKDPVEEWATRLRAVWEKRQKVGHGAQARIETQDELAGVITEMVAAVDQE
jgi:hypothetical protein